MEVALSCLFHWLSFIFLISHTTNSVRWNWFPQSILKHLPHLKADSHIACRDHAVPLPCRAAKGLECVFPIWFTECGRVWFTLAMPHLCHALTMPFFSRPRHSTAVERRPVGYLPAFGFFRLPRGVSRRLLSEAYQSSSQRSIPTTVKSGRLQPKCDGTRWRTGGAVKGKLANGVGNQCPSHYLGTWCIQHYYRRCANLGCQ